MILLLLSAALAGPLDRKTTMGEWPETQVAAEQVIPRGWLDVGVVFDTKRATQYRGTGGYLYDYADGTVFRTSNLRVQVTQGFSDRITLSLDAPYVMSRLQSAGGADLRTRALGDVSAGLLVQPWLGRPWSVGFGLDLKTPSGVEWPSNLSGDLEGLLTGTGAFNLGGSAIGRIRLGGRVALETELAYVLKFPAVVGYVIQENGWANGWLDPGDATEAALRGTVQIIDPLALDIGARASRRAAHRMGVSGEGTTSLELSPLRDSEALFVDGDLGASIWPSDRWALGYVASVQIYGTDSRLFSPLGLEELSPQPGWTHSVSAEVRW